MISLDFTLILVILNFIVLLVILNKLLYKPISQFLTDRKARIAQDEKDANDAKVSAEKYAVQKENELKNAAEEIRTMKKSAQKDAEKSAQVIIDDARNREKKILSETEIQLEHEKEKAVIEVKDELAKMLTELSGKFLTKKIDKAEDNKLITSILERGYSEK